MTPTPQEHSSAPEDIPTPQQLDGNRIVISGMSGLYPDSYNVKELSDILYNKVNPVTSEALRFQYKHPEVVQLTGTVPDISYFDAQFFKVHFRLAFAMDPMARKILEQSYQAIYDAGINPSHLSGKKVGVYIGSCFSETEKACFYEAAARSGFGIAGCSKTMFANRISYWLNAKGPSMSIDEACCSSTAAVEQAYLDISRGECEAAIVGGSYLCLHPQSSVHYGRILRLCSDGKTKSFDVNADGCAKSEAINVLFLQKAKDALRIYAQVLHVKSEFTCVLKNETGPKYGFYRDLSSTTNFIKKFYKDADVSPQAVEYVEAFGSGIPEADKIELQTIEEVFCKNRNDPLLIGSVMSNIGYNEAASGISAITKVLLGYHTGKLAGNLHCEHPRQDIAALREGRMRVITEHQQFRSTYVAINGMSIFGVNSHVLLHGYNKPKDLNRYKSNIPYLVNISARQEEAVKDIIKELKSNPVDPEQLALLHNIHRSSISGHLGRGFVILQTNEEQKTVSLYEKGEYFDDAKPPLWYVYSGMGSQWAGMGKQLMRIPIFAAAIERCHKALEPKGLNIVDIITSPDESMFNNILHSFVGIAAIQIGLTDILKELGLKPDGIIGHSVGELGCAYADGCLTATQMILSAYYRGLVSLETKFIHGSMAAVGMGYEQIKQICPPEIDVACHNGPDSSTISGPANVMREFVAELVAKEIFAKEVPCSNIAYHSRYIADAGPHLLKYLNEAIDIPKARSERWISSSVPKDRWDEPIAKYCSSEYLTNNLLNPVLFEETSRLIPSNAVLVEIAPHGLLQAILKRSLPATCKNIALTRRQHPDNTLLLLEAIGQLFMEGFNSNVNILYPKVEMPVSTGTPFLSHLVKWAHGEEWALPLYSNVDRKNAAICNFIIALQDKEQAYLKGHSIRDNTLYPFAASLTLVWDTLAMILGVPRKHLSVEFTDLELYVQPVLHERKQLKLNVSIHRGTGRFEISDGKSKVIAGFINPLNDKKVTNSIMNKEEKKIYFTADDIYQLFRDRDYWYSGEFKSINSVDESLSAAMIIWRNNWVTFIDGILQLQALRQPHHAVSLPVRIRSMQIDVIKQQNCINLESKTSSGHLMQAEIFEEFDSIRCGGVLLKNIKFQNLPSVVNSELVLRTKKFVPNFQSKLDASTSLEVYIQIVSENINKNALTVVEVSSQTKEGTVFNKIDNLINNTFGIKVKHEKITREIALRKYDFKSVDLILVQNLSTDENLLHSLQEILEHDQFIVSEEDLGSFSHPKPSSLYRVLSVHSIDQNISNDPSELHLIRWGRSQTFSATTTISVRNEADFSFLVSVHDNLASDQRLLVISPYPSPTGLKELISSWRKESAQNKIHLIVIKDDGDKELESKLRGIELAFNIVKHGYLGAEFLLPVKDNALVCENIMLQNGQLGGYDSLNWVEAPVLTGPGVTVSVHFAGINNNVIKKGSGALYSKQHLENKYGSDFSGITNNGERVMGIVPTGAVSSKVRAVPELLWPVPAHWSLEDAATVPLAYAQAFYCLAIKFKLYRGISILVHGGAGALGQAIISIALAHDCEVYTTVSDLRKKNFLLKLFPSLKADHIGCSRDRTFADMVISVSKNQGCELVISCLKEDLKDRNVECNNIGGYVLDISQLQNQDGYNLGMSNLAKEKHYVCVDFSSIFKNMEDTKAINTLISEGIARGYVHPLSRVTYAAQEPARAFRLLAMSQHRGRVLLRIKDNVLLAQQRLRCSVDRCHLIICNQVTFGLHLADRLVARGVRKLYLHVQTQSPYIQHKIRLWRKLGVKVVVSSTDLNKQNVSALINDALDLGVLEGVYVTVGDQSDSSANNLIKKMDSIVRKTCHEIKYFAVLNVGDHSIGKEVCLQRVSDQLPVTLLAIPELNDGSHIGCSGWRGAVAAVEQALLSPHCELWAHVEHATRPPLLQQLATLAKINIPDDAEKSLTLQKLGVQSHKLPLLCYLLRVHYNLSFDEEQVSLLTIDKILDLEQTVVEKPYEDIKGLKTFFSYVDSDELLATTEMVFLPTLSNSETMRDDECKFDQEHMCIVPGMEGHYERFRVLCDRFKLPALVLQPGLDHPNETLKEMAQRFAKILLQKTEIKDSFYLIGYESGVLVALEMAAVLEDHGLTGTVLCIGCAPDELQKEVEEYLKEYENEDQLQDGVLRHMYSLMVGGDTSGIEDVLDNAATWSEKVEACVRISLGRVSHSSQYARALITSTLGRINQLRNYRPVVQPLRSRLVLLRAATAQGPLQEAAFQRYSLQPVAVHQLSTSLAHVANDLNCAAIIDEYLSPETIEQFTSKNICDTYILNATSFVKLVNRQK